MFFHIQPKHASEKPSHSPFSSRPWRPFQAFVVCLFLLFLVLFGSQGPLAYGAGLSNVTLHATNSSPSSKSVPNLFNPKSGAQSKTTSYKPGPVGTQKPQTPQPISHAVTMPMNAGSVDLKVGQTAQFVGSDGHLDVTVPGDAITAADLAQAGGKLTLQVSQIAPPSGSNAGGSGHLSLGTYLFQLVDAKGVLVDHGLRKALSMKYHYGKSEAALNLSHAYIVQNGVLPLQSTKLAPTKANIVAASTFGALSSQAVKLDTTQHILQATPAIGTPSASMSWQSDASIGTFGKPDPFNVDLNAGGLTSNLPLTLPAGPGGLTPPVSLSYSSESVNGQTNPSGATGWVGEGWSLNLGEISWSEHNVYAGCTTTACGGGVNWENIWQLSDPYGTSSELIPPNIDVSTFYDDTYNTYCGTTSNTAHPCPIQWHTATESHAKIYSYIGPNSLPNMSAKPPCFRVWLPNGIMEEFGCTPDSLQHYYQASVGAHVVSGWLLDMITDPQGNQIHITYQQDVNTFTDPTTQQSHQAIRDAVLSTIEYDSPNCHDAQNMCTGSNWNPLVRVSFQASHAPKRLTGTAPGGCNTGANLRCDDPFDLSGSGGVTAPEVQSTFVLNDALVQIRSNAAAGWNTLHDYQLGYEQSAPTTITDPSSGRQQSVAGMLDLTHMQEVGDTGASALLYSGMDNNSNSSYAYMKVFDLSSQPIVVGPNTTLSYWIYPQSSTNNGLVSGNNSTCVAIDLVFTDGTQLRDSGAVDQHGNRLHPASQCGHLTLDQWNQVISNIGSGSHGKTISKIDVGYDQGANTGGYRGYLDDISLSDPTSTTPLFATSFESGDPQPTWTNTVDNGPESGSGRSNNVGGICCGLTGPEAFVGNEFAHADSAALPMRTFSYTSQTNYYEDDQFHPNPSNNCGPSWNTGNGSGCLLWGQNYVNNNRFLTSSSNGMGLAQTFNWALARSNTHGVPGGGSNNADPLYCNSHQSGYPCNEADDQSWSHVVLTQTSDTTIRLTQNGQVGAQSSTLNFHGANDGNWGGNVQTLNVTVNLNAGNNTILFGNASGGAPSIDRISVGGQSYEAEGSGNTLAGGAVVTNCSSCSGGAQVGFLGNGGTLQFNNINVSNGGSASVTISYIDADVGRSAQMTVNGASTPVISTTGYNYQLSYPLASQQCSDCVAGMYWGNQNDIDYLSYYNNQFMGFAQATVSLPSGAKEVHKYYATEGIGIYDPNEVTCYAPTPCHASPWWSLGNAAHGREYQSLAYDTNGTTLLKQTNNTYQAVCPPSGVAATPTGVMNGHTSTWDGNLVSELDHNNPVAVCDVQETQSVNQTIDGSGNNSSTTTASTYDSYGRVTQTTKTTNGGTPSSVIKKTAYVWNDAITATQTGATGTYIIDTPASTVTEDSAGNRYTCSYTSYDGVPYTTGSSSTLTAGLTTLQDAYTSCGTAANGYTVSGLTRTTHTYDQYGNSISTDDADANANIAGHTGCTINSVQHTNCSVYDSTFATLMTSSTNALNQTASTGYTTTAPGGFGIWPISTTDANNQTSTYTYDALGRMTSQTLPGETSGDTTRNWAYTAWCTGTAAQAPCLEIDQVNRLDSSNTTVSRAFYDSEGRLIETRAPSPNGQDVVTYAYYDPSGVQVFKSNPYFVTAYIGVGGPAAYSIPDSTQPGTSTAYSTLLQTSATDPNSHTTTTTNSVVCGVSGTSDMGCYVQMMVLDADGHERAALTGGFGKTSYIQIYTGNSSATYALYATTKSQYDAAGHLLSTVAPDGSTTASYVYDGLGRVTTRNDPDSGTATATYDPNGNLTTLMDARGSTGTVYTGYDGLNRQVWRNSSNSSNGALDTYTYDSTANSNNGIGKVTAESFTGSGGLSGSYAMTYDARGQGTSITTTVNGTSYPIHMAYNDSGQPISQTYPTGEVVTVGYGSTGWMTGLVTTTSSVTTTLASNLTYTGLAGAAGHVTAMNLDGSLYNYAATFDSGMHLTSTSLANSSTSSVLYQTQLAYDAVNTVTSVQTSISGQTDTQQFCYDNLYRLTWAGTNGTPPCSGTSISAGTLTSAQYQQSNSYDVDGRLTSGPSGTNTFGSSAHPHAVTSSSNGYSAAYDAAGNMTCRALTSATTCAGTQTGQQLSYDPQGRLTSWQNQPSSPTQTANYLYDGLGNRVAMQTTVSGTTTLTAYIGSIEEVQTTGGTTQTTTYYTVAGKRIAAKVNSTFYYFGYDAVGSLVAVLNASGTLVGAKLYGSYGSSRYSTGILPTSIGFTGQHGDSVTGLDYYVARYYDPAVGMFLSVDQKQGNALGMDPYGYVSGNPETWTDPTGHWGWDWGTFVMSVAVVVVVVVVVAVVVVAAPVVLTAAATITASDLVVAGIALAGGTEAETLIEDSAPVVDDVTTKIADDTTVTAPEGSTTTPEGSTTAPDSGTPNSASNVQPDQGGSQRITLYRAVNQYELNDVLRLGDYHMNPSYAGKYFALTEEGAQNFANAPLNRGLDMTVTSIDVSSDWLNIGFQFDDHSLGAGPSLHIEDDLLPALYDDMSGLPSILDASWIPPIE